MIVLANYRREIEDALRALEPGKVRTAISIAGHNLAIEHYARRLLPERKIFEPRIRSTLALNFEVRMSG